MDRRTYISSVMTIKSSGSSPDKRRKYDEAFKAESLRLAAESRSTQAAARQLGISPNLLYRWQQAQVVAEVGSVEVARDPEVRALRTRLNIPVKQLLFQGASTPEKPGRARCQRYLRGPSGHQVRLTSYRPAGTIQPRIRCMTSGAVVASSD